MFFCLDSEGIMNSGKTLTEAYKKAEKSGRCYSPEDCEFFEGNEIKVEYEIVPATQVNISKKKGSK